MSTNFKRGAGERRRKPAEVRSAALDVGRRLLIEGGPAALTLKAVGGALGMSHANLIHHFGSAETFQAALRARMVEELTRTMADLLQTGRAGNMQDIVDRVFEAYGAGGIGTLMAWTSLSPAAEEDTGPIAAVRDLVAVIEPLLAGPDRTRRARAMVALVTSLALADSLIGDKLRAAVAGDGAQMRRLAVTLLEHLRAADAS